MTEHSNSALIAQITERLKAALSPEVLNIIDDSKDHIGHAGSTPGSIHITVEISKSTLPAGRLAAHRAVYACLEDQIPYPIHAVRVKLV